VYHVIPPRASIAAGHSLVDVGYGRLEAWCVASMAITIYGSYLRHRAAI
jgi:hypothetical protein